MFIERARAKQAIKRALKRNPITILVGPRQCGKTTLAREFVQADSLNYFDLEDPQSLERLQEPMTVLGELTGTVVIDEVQKQPELFPILRVLVDRKSKNGQFLILGSASPDLLKQSSESLAGRAEVISLDGFSLSEVGISAFQKLWVRGGFPRSFLAASNQNSVDWRGNFIQMFLERDVPQFGFRVASATLLRFWTMLAHYHGQIFNAAEIAQAMNVSQPTVRRYVDLLESLFMVRQLRPWYTNIKKRQVKMPKIYVRDSGLFHSLLKLDDLKQILNHPKSGASWEGFVIEEVLKRIPFDEAYFWATHSGAELDLLLLHEGHLYGVECKRVDAPRVTASMRSALDNLQLEKLTVIYPGKLSYKLADRINAMPVALLAAPEAERIVSRK